MKSILPVIAALLSFCASAAQVDGPYVIRSADGQLEALTVESAGATTQHIRPVAVGESVSVAAIGSLPAFKVTLRKPAAIEADSVSVAPSTPLFVVADTHGEYEIAGDMLRAQHVVNAQLDWSFGRGHLVILGDVFDRGANQLEILWLLYKLEAQARKAGGGLHLLLGNHEVMVMRGDLRYMNPKYAQTTTAAGVQSYSQLFKADSVLGQWLRTRPAILRINDQLFLHGGVSRGLVERRFSLAAINEGVRSGLTELPPFGAAERERAEFLSGPGGPLWYRGYFGERNGEPAATAGDIDLALKQFGVRRIFVGHTIVPTITSLYDGKVIAVQVYPDHDTAGHEHFEALLIKGGKLLRALPDGSTQPLY